MKLPEKPRIIQFTVYTGEKDDALIETIIESSVVFCQTGKMRQRFADLITDALDQRKKVEIRRID